MRGAQSVAWTASRRPLSNIPFPFPRSMKSWHLVANPNRHNKVIQRQKHDQTWSYSLETGRFSFGSLILSFFLLMRCQRHKSLVTLTECLTGTGLNELSTLRLRPTFITQKGGMELGSLNHIVGQCRICMSWVPYQFIPKYNLTRSSREQPTTARKQYREWAKPSTLERCCKKLCTKTHAGSSICQIPTAKGQSQIPLLTP